MGVDQHPPCRRARIPEVVTGSSANGFAETLSNLLGAITGRGLAVFAQFDHAAAARDVGLEMAPEVVVVFGNPRAGTPLMQSDPRIGVELPLRMLLWEADGVTMVGYNDPRDLDASYAVGEQITTLETMSKLLADLAHEAAAKR
jgi:uncharacterized protein (DUF302 family)